MLRDDVARWIQGEDQPAPPAPEPDADAVRAFGRALGELLADQLWRELALPPAPRASDEGSS